MKTVSKEIFAGSLPALLLRDTDVTPSWQRYGKGSSEVHAYGKEGNGKLSLWVTEFAEKSKRCVVVDLDRAQVVALRNLCNTILGDTK